MIEQNLNGVARIADLDDSGGAQTAKNAVQYRAGMRIGIGHKKGQSRYVDRCIVRTEHNANGPLFSAPYARIQILKSGVEAAV